MSALQNIGEFASPYYLREVWARREEIDIDPETYASLKRKVRALVRDARAFEMRGEEPDEDWRARRVELLGVDTVEERSLVIDDGSEFRLGIWRNGLPADALLLGDLPGFVDPDRRRDGQEPPSTAFELALDAYDGEADWGLLLAGLEVRVYRRSSGISQQYLALNLDTLVELDDEADWRAFAGIFRAPAFVPDSDGIPLIRRVVDESRRHATRLADDMRTDLVHAAEALIQGALDHPDNRTRLGDPSRAQLQELFEQTLYYLYRILFILYAEARDVLPLSGAGPYRTTYSVDRLVELAREGDENLPGSYFGETIERLFNILWEGPPELARALGVDPVGGELFDPGRTRLLDRLSIGDPAWRKALTSVAIGAPGSERRRLGRRSSFAELGVDQLGSIYEGLLVLEPFLAPGPRVLARVDGERRVLEPGQEGDFRVERRLVAGDFVLESASGRRKGTGSFYTPAEITKYLAEAALDPLLDVIVAEAENQQIAAAEILKLRVLDPAMGSGAFLVQAARVLGLALARIRAGGGDVRVTPEMVLRAKRDVVRRCLYGVDLNPLAVVLAKVSLWLEVVERGKPLTFLDAHLRCGDSLVGIDLVGEAGALRVDQLAEWPKDAVRGLGTYLKNEAGDRGKPVIERLKTRKAPRNLSHPTLPGVGAGAVLEALEEIAAERESLLAFDSDSDTLQLELETARAFDELEHEEASLRNRVRAAADFWCAQWFAEGEDAPCDGNGPVVPVGVGEYEEILRSLLGGTTVRDRLERHVEAARRVAEQRRFFHWALEFPEVMLERGGFDAAIGNPPWNTLSPDVKEFFSTYDPQTFRKGVPKAEQEARKAELRADDEVDAAWRREARFLHELSHYAKPDSRRYTWFAHDPQLRKGDANVFRLFVERAHRLLRKGGRMAQVLPDSVYVSSPATGVRRRLLEEGRLERCYVFENRRKIFPIDSRIKVVLLVAERGGGPTERFRAAFFVGKDAAGRERAVSLEELPDVLAELDQAAPELAVADVRALAPATWSFPELQTALDAEIAVHCAATVPPLNLDERGWGLTYCRELDADKDAWRFKDAKWLEEQAAVRNGLSWTDPDGVEWWPLVEGALFYHLEFPAEGKEPDKWVNGEEVAAIEARKNPDGSSAMEHYRVAWRDVASATNERSAIAAVLPPRTAAKHKAPTVWGGSVEAESVLLLAALMSAFCFDYLVRYRGATSLTYGILNSVPAPARGTIEVVLPLVTDVVARSDELDGLRVLTGGSATRPSLDHWQVAERRTQIDAVIAHAYKLSLVQYTAVLSTFPNLDTIQPMLPGEPKSFVTRDLALLAYATHLGEDPPDIVTLLEAAGVELPPPKPEYRRLDARVEAYRARGAVPYRPTPRGGRVPTDPELIAAVRDVLASSAQTVAELAEVLEEDEQTVKSVLDGFVKDGEAFAEGRGKNRGYYVLDEEV